MLTLLVAVVGLVVLAPLPAYAFENRAFGDVFVERGQTEPEVSTAVGDVTVEGVVDGDVRSGLGDIEVSGEGVKGDINAGFGDVTVRAPVDGEIAGFGDVYLDAPVRGDVNVGREIWSWDRRPVVDGDITSGSGEIMHHPEAVVEGR